MQTRKMLHNARFLSILFLSTFLCSCWLPPFSKLQPSPPESLHGTGGDIPVTKAGGLGALFSVNKNTKNGLIKQLRKDDIEVVEYGEFYTLIVPTDRFYQFNSAEFNDICYPGLVNIAKLLHYYPNRAIHVAAFTDNVGSQSHKVKLTQARAEKMVGFLWANQIKATLLHPEGYADKYPVGDNHLIHGSAYNRRIEIQWDKNYHQVAAAQEQFSSWKK